MRIVRDNQSPWGQRVWFEDIEFDVMMDEARARAGKDVFTEGRGVDVEIILERVYGVVADYIDLPSGILGRTRFYPDGRLEVEVSRELSEAAELDDVARRRLRSTLGHECGHIVAHGHLHLEDTRSGRLFEQESVKEPSVLCRGEAIGSFKSGGYGGRWWEYQANRAMASLLLPRNTLMSHVKHELEKRGTSNMEEVLCAGELETLTRNIMQTFDVSMSVTSYRLQELGHLPKSRKQAVLGMEE